MKIMLRRITVTLGYCILLWLIVTFFEETLLVRMHVIVVIILLRRMPIDTVIVFVVRVLFILLIHLPILEMITIRTFLIMMNRRLYLIIQIQDKVRLFLALLGYSWSYLKFRLFLIRPVVVTVMLVFLLPYINVFVMNFITKFVPRFLILSATSLSSSRCNLWLLTIKVIYPILTGYLRVFIRFSALLSMLTLLVLLLIRMLRFYEKTFARLLTVVMNY